MGAGGSVPGFTFHDSYGKEDCRGLADHFQFAFDATKFDILTQDANGRITKEQLINEMTRVTSETRALEVFRTSRNVQNLLNKQHEHCPRILKELQQHGRKISHWAWYVFPTEKPGISEPKPETFVDPGEREAFLLLSQATGWRACLELLAELVSKNEFSLEGILPLVDHGRVDYFCQHWGHGFEAPPWLKDAIAIFDVHKQKEQERAKQKNKSKRKQKGKRKSKKNVPSVYVTVNSTRTSNTKGKQSEEPSPTFDSSGWTKRDLVVESMEPLGTCCVLSKVLLRVITYRKEDKYGNGHTVRRSYKIETGDPEYRSDPAGYVRKRDDPGYQD